MTTVTLAPTFGQSLHDFTGHPVVEEMARDLLGATPSMMATLASEDGKPTFRLMSLANDRFAERTGTRGRFIGAIGNAVLARLATLRAEAQTSLLASLPNTATEAHAAELEARQAIRDMWAHGSPRCPLTKYAVTAGRAADAFNA